MLSVRRKGERKAGDERIRGGGKFVERMKVLSPEKARQALDLIWYLEDVEDLGILVGAIII